MLPGYAVLSFAASRRVNRNLEVFVGVQNLTDREYFVGTLPTTIGTPRLFNGGVRVLIRAEGHEVAHQPEPTSGSPSPLHPS